MAPLEYINARCRRTNDDDSDNDDNNTTMVITNNTEKKFTVDGRPYMPFLHATIDDFESIKNVALCIVSSSTAQEIQLSHLTIQRIFGGITNSLYRVSGFKTSTIDGQVNDGNIPNSVLVRVFGAEGMIDRDVENATYAALAREKLAPEYYGRFGNGRIEEWMDGTRPLQTKELSIPDISNSIASELGEFHAKLKVPNYLKEYHNPTKPNMWTQLRSWCKQAMEDASFDCKEDKERYDELKISNTIPNELNWLQESVVPSDSKVAFCHNDLLAANILYNEESTKIQLIDFEYGGINYCYFDIANHFNEFAGGTDNGVPDYHLFPSQERQRDFIEHYLKSFHTCSNDGDHGNSSNTVQIESKEIQSAMQDVNRFILANHLYWGLWAVNQASTEGCKEFDYLLYAKNRITRYFECKAKTQ